MNVVRWWARFGFATFVLTSLSLLFLLVGLSLPYSILLFAQLPLYLATCALAVLSLIKIVKAFLNVHSTKTKLLPTLPIEEKATLTMQKPDLVLKKSELVLTQLEKRQEKDGVAPPETTEEEYVAWLEKTSSEK